MRDDPYDIAEFIENPNAMHYTIDGIEKVRHCWEQCLRDPGDAASGDQRAADQDQRSLLQDGALARAAHARGDFARDRGTWHRLGLRCRDAGGNAGAAAFALARSSSRPRRQFFDRYPARRADSLGEIERHAALAFEDQ
jgi:hypothetical protein